MKAGRETAVEGILTGATMAFSEKGFAATTMRQIALASGSSLGGIYHHFDSKEGILRAIIVGNFTRVIASLDERLAGVDDPREALGVFVENHISFFARHLDQMRVMAHELDTLAGEAGREVAALRRAYTERARRILNALQPARGAEQLDVDVLCLFGMLIWTYRWIHTVDDTFDPPRLAARMTSLYLDGFCGVNSG